MPEPAGEPPPPSAPIAAPPAAGSPQPRRIAGGFTVPEYEARVWDMAKHQLHPAALHVVACVAGWTRLSPHPRFDAPGAAWIELAFLVCVFLGAWACFWSTMLRVAGLPSLTVTILVPLSAATALATWFVLPGPAELSERACLAALGALAAPGPVAFALTWRRWRAHRRAHLHLLPEADR